MTAGRAGRNRESCRRVLGYARLTGALVLTGTCYLAAVALGPAQAVSRISGNGSPAVTSSLAAPVDIVIAVDESQSIKRPEITLEETAARLIALGEFSLESRIGVLGFGGPNKETKKETNPPPPVDEVCPMTEVDTLAAKESLSTCIGNLHPRTPGQGDHTDFIDAIKDGVADLAGTGDTGRPLLLFLLTDGQLDMADAPGFSGNEAVANTEGNSDLQETTLPMAKAAGVRIWPLGFGPAVDLQELQAIASGGAQGSCNAALPDATPHAFTVASASEIDSKLPQIFANARCLAYVPGTSASIGPGGSANLSVKVPGVATSGSLEVIRQFPQVSVTYFDPAGRPVPVPTGSMGGQSFSLAGANGPVEALSVGYPLPGLWRVHVAAGPGIPPGTLVTASVLWHGVLHCDIVAAPADPAPGQAVTVTVKLQLGTRPLSASDLAGVQVSVQVTGRGLAQAISVPVNDNGIPPDQAAHDGVYNGTFTVPRSATGTLTVMGIVSAQGVSGDTRTVPVAIDSNGLLVTGKMTLPAGQVDQGGQVTGTIRLSNPASEPHTIRLLPVDAPPGVTVTPATISLPPASGTRSFQFTLHFAHSVPVGAVTGHVNAVDAATGVVYAQAAITNEVVAPPKIPQRWWFWPLAAFSTVTAGITLWLLYGRRSRYIPRAA